MRVKRRHVVRLLTVIAVGLGPGVVFTRRALAQNATYNLNHFKAAALLNFARYTEWPKDTFASDSEPFRIRILGKDPFGKDIDIIKTKDVRGRKLDIQCISSVEEAKDCQMLFIAVADKSSVSKILKAVEKTSVLTVAETDGFLEAKGMINLVVETAPTGASKVGFEVNLAVAQKANLKMDAQMLKLAKQVKT